MTALSPKRLLFVSGKGGVGKSSVAAALALLYSQEKKQTLLVEVNSLGRLSSLLACPSSHIEPKLVEPYLWMLNLQFQSALREYALMVLKYEPLYRTVFENRWTQQLLHFIPSLQELVLLGKLLFHAQEKTPEGKYRFDKIIVDAPATGHITRLLSLPSVLLRTVPPGPLAQEAQWMETALQAPSTATLLVSLPTEMAVQETLELHVALQTQAHMHIPALLLNRFVPPLFEKDELQHPTLLKYPHLLPLALQHYTLAKESLDAFSHLSQLHIPVFKLPCLPSEYPARNTVSSLAAHLQKMKELL
ncbi:MAG: ArsA family ATPase [Cystobacterineae bacterium]|nr:ArsA family ATPase [Cystobacterineae bacterium]